MIRVLTRVKFTGPFFIHQVFHLAGAFLAANLLDPRFQGKTLSAERKREAVHWVQAQVKLRYPRDVEEGGAALTRYLADGLPMEFFQGTSPPVFRVLVCVFLLRSYAEPVGACCMHPRLLSNNVCNLRLQANGHRGNVSGYLCCRSPKHYFYRPGEAVLDKQVGTVKVAERLVHGECKHVEFLCTGAPSRLLL